MCCVRVGVCVNVCGVCVHAHACAFMCVWAHAHVYARMHVCVHVHVYDSVSRNISKPTVVRFVLFELTNLIHFQQVT